MSNPFNKNHSTSTGDNSKPKTENQKTPFVEDGISCEMLSRLKEGDHEVFNKVFFKYYAPVKNFLTALTGSCDDAEEICQDVFANLWTSRSHIDPDKSIRSYIYAIARDESYDYLKKHKKLDSSATPPKSDSQSSSEEMTIARETELLVRLAVNRMPPQRKKIFEMSRMQGLNNEEISQQLGISNNAVEKHIASALKEIRDTVSTFLTFFLFA